MGWDGMGWNSGVVRRGSGHAVGGYGKARRDRCGVVVTGMGAVLCSAGPLLVPARSGHNHPPNQPESSPQTLSVATVQPTDSHMTSSHRQ